MTLVTAIYKGERVTVLFDGKDMVSLWIPSRQEEVWVKRNKIVFDIKLSRAETPA